MKKLILLTVVCGLLTALAQHAHADARPNPRAGGALSQTAAPTSTSREQEGAAEAKARETAAENTRANRTTQNRGVVVTGTPAGIRTTQPAAQTVTARAASSLRTPSLSSRGLTAGSSDSNKSAVARSAAITNHGAQRTSNAARSAVRTGVVGAIRTGKATGANTSRATAIFSNTSAMGSDYAQCREGYFACMDQFCGLKSDTYRRCLCSDKFRDFKDREDAFDAAKQMITEFNDNNLNAIGLSAAEVGAMYSASEGEAAIRRDTSASAQMLASINDLLSGKAKAPTVISTQKTVAAKVLDLSSFSASVGDIWGDGGGDIFSSGGSSNMWSSRSAGPDIESMEGKTLYNEVHKQCMDMSASCRANQATGNMVTSAYTVLISQDCSAYEKKLDAQKSALESTIREANNLMKEARLEEYRARNSASVNECIGKVRAEMMNTYACGPSWERCLDFTGKYVNQSTGEPIYSAVLFQLKDTIDLDGKNDIFNQSLDNLRNRASSALNTCRNDADLVWSEFKRQAIIEIAQAQDEKIESVKDGCISIMKECYDKQTGAMNEFSTVSGDDDMSSGVQRATAGLGQRAAKAMCTEKVAGCASLYCPRGTPCKTCEWDQSGKITNAAECGAQTLIAFVDTVDDTKISMMCKRDLEEFIKSKETGCTPAGADTPPCIGAAQDKVCTRDEEEAYMKRLGKDQRRAAYPFKCRNLPFRGAGSVHELLLRRAMISCVNPTNGNFDPAGYQAIDEIMEDLKTKMQGILAAECGEQSRGIWIGNLPSDDTIQVVAEYKAGLYPSDLDFAKTLPQGTNAVLVGNDSTGNAVVSGANTILGTAGPLSITGTNNAGIDVGGIVAKLAEDTSMGNAQGWGYCMLAGNKVLCEQMNALINGGQLAVYDEAAQTCGFTPQYYEVVCRTVLSGRWDGRECTFVP
ncbi:MAG: hypothetical protein LBQ49_03035 [Rickettsiales bacterium]|jgi:hypothetical protein|nr:hypothetical protein [Rickettsiales bacterium]